MLTAASLLPVSPTVAPTILIRRASRPVRIHEVSLGHRSLVNTVKWFSQSRFGSAVLFGEESTVPNSCAWPARLGAKRVGIFGNVYSRNKIEKTAQFVVVSRGLRTKTRGSRDLRNAGDPTLKSEAHHGAPLRGWEDHGPLRLLKDLHDSDPKERLRLIRAFLEGGKFLPRTSTVLVYLSVAMVSLFLALIGFDRNKTKGKKKLGFRKVTFEDVVGVEEAKQALWNIVKYLKNPTEISRLGGKLPKGALLVGPPGTGKTLLARAVACEAGVHFLYASGSGFDEMFVGMGALRIRLLFKLAKMYAPCVIFIDEIDSVGRKRSNSASHPHANQTINQLLSEMDGFVQNEGIIVLAATNRRDDLDKALLRSGRFDVEIELSPPDVRARKKLFEYYVSKIKYDQNINTAHLARSTSGFTGAAIKNVVNQAALRAAIDGQSFVTQAYLENARDKVLMGPENRSRMVDHEDNLIAAYREGGRAVVSYFSKDSMEIHKITIVPRAQSLGRTVLIPSKDEAYVKKSRILALMDMLMGGRAAEELIFGEERVTNRAGAEFRKATDLATNMVRHWGMSEEVGYVAAVNDLSESMTELVDEEIKRALSESMERARHILTTHQHELKLLAEALLEHETLSGSDVKQLIETGTLTR